MSNFVVVSDTTNLAGGGQINYTLSSTTTPNSEKTLEVLIRAPDGSILASSTNSYDNRSQIQSTINRQLDNKLNQVNLDLIQVQNDISSLTSILNNPNTPPDQIRNAEAQLTIAQEEQTTLEKAQTNITVTTTRLIADQQPPPATPTISNTTTPAPAAPAGNNALQGTASDDSGAQPTTPTSTATAADGAAQTGPAEEPSINAPEKPGTQREGAAEPNSTKGTPPYENEEFDRKPVNPGERPGKRLKNPLGSLASYNYQLSLYMVSPDAYDAFIASGRRNINTFSEQFAGSVAADEVPNMEDRGVFLVAQSGGSRPTERTSEFKYDYYIDDLSFKHLCNAKETSGPTGNIEFSFKITEPYGFSLITNLKKAQTRIRSKATNNPTKQFFMLGIRFYGWDQSGRQVTGQEIIDGNPLDFNASGSGAIFETFYDLVISSIKFKIDGKASVYTFTAASTSPAVTVNLRKGMVNTAIEAYGSTVREMLSGPKGLITLLNQEQQKLKENGTITVPTVYKIKWVGDAEQIGIASVISETRTNKSTQAASQATNTNEVNPSTDTKASPNNNQERLNFSNVPIIQAIDQIIARSKYIEDSMSKNYKDTNESDPETDSLPSDSSPNRQFKWFRITPAISGIEWDEKIKDWSFTITYNINTYLTPILDSPYVQNNVKYYGPHKRYDYWYTGENSEIVSYEQQLNNSYFNNVVGGEPKNTQVAQSGNKEGNASSVPGQGPAVLVNTPPPGDNTGTQGTPNMASVNSVRTTLYDPGSFATAKINILGDPDYLMQEVATTSTGLNKAYSRFYEDGGFTINPTGGQVFIEIDFKEGVDYSSDEFTDSLVGVDGLQSVGGTLAINDSILFWDYNPEAQKIIKGISYKLISVTSRFSKGAFTQTLSAVINDFGTKTALTAEARQEAEAEEAEKTEKPKTTGTTEDPPKNDPAPGNSSTPAPTTTTPAPTTPPPEPNT